MNEKISEFYAFLPMLLACDDKYQKISARGCYLYSLMLSRMNLSEKNKHRFSDEKGVYIYFSLEEMCKYLNCSKPTAIATVQELVSAELITKGDVARGKSPKYYVKQLKTIPKTKQEEKQGPQQNQFFTPMNYEGDDWATKKMKRDRQNFAEKRKKVSSSF
jgi:hypothetical protein